jgi:putative nucleotidyltransferase with HDIG domain
MNTDKVILIVDDNPDVRLLLKDFLETINYRTEEAQTGEEALTRLNGNGKIDMVLLDINLPDTSGVELLPKILEQNPSLPVAMITGYPTIELAIDCIRKGAADFIIKPFQLDQLNLTISRILKKEEKDPKVIISEGKNQELEELKSHLNRKMKELNVLYTISEVMNSAKGVEDLFNKLVNLACDIVEAHKAYFMLLDKDNGEMVVKAAKGLNANNIQDPCLVQTFDLVNEVIEKGEPLLLTDLESCFLPPFLKGNSLISVPLRIKNKPFGILYVIDKADGSGFSQSEASLLHILVQKASLNIENTLLYERIFESIAVTLRVLVEVLEAKDPYTKVHSQRVTKIALLIADELGCSQEDKETIKFAGYLHDIGKVGIQDSILMKPGKLTPEEYEIIKTHPVIGEKILLPLGLLPQERTLIRHHHERWDGAGYPDKLVGDQIPYLALILAVADVYDAITSDRPYRQAKPRSEAIKEIEKESGSHFQPDIVKALKRKIDERL